MAEVVPCAWCDRPSVTEVITRPGRQNRRTAPVCEEHAKDFEDRDILTVRVELDRKAASTQKKREYLKRAQPWR